MFTWSKRKTGFQPGGLQWNSGYVAGWWLSTLKSSEVPSDFKKKEIPAENGLFWTSPWNRMPAFILMSCRPCHSDASVSALGWGQGEGRKQRRTETLRSFFVNYLQVLTYICVRTVFPLIPNPTSPPPSTGGKQQWRDGSWEIQVSGFGADSLWFCASLELCCKISHSIYDYVHIFH